MSLCCRFLQAGSCAPPYCHFVVCFVVCWHLGSFRSTTRINYCTSRYHFLLCREEALSRPPSMFALLWLYPPARAPPPPSTRWRAIFRTPMLPATLLPFASCVRVLRTYWQGTLTRRCWSCTAETGTIRYACVCVFSHHSPYLAPRYIRMVCVCTERMC